MKYYLCTADKTVLARVDANGTDFSAIIEIKHYSKLLIKHSKNARDIVDAFQSLSVLPQWLNAQTLEDMKNHPDFTPFSADASDQDILRDMLQATLNNVCRRFKLDFYQVEDAQAEGDSVERVAE